MKKPTIIITGPRLESVSGVSTHLRNILNSELKNKFNFIHFKVGSQGHNENKIEKFTRIISSPFVLGFYIKKNNAQIIHLNPSMDKKSFFRDSSYLLISKIKKCKIIYQVHGGEMPSEFCKNNKFLKLMMKYMLKMPDKIVLLGNYALKAYEDFMPGLPLIKIPNSIYTSRYNFGPKAKKDYLKIGYIGRLEENKGILNSLKAINLLKNDPIYGKIKFFIVGSGPIEEKIKEYITKYKMEEMVKLFGPMFGENKINFWKDIDLFIFPTYHKEGLPYSLLESIASATPVITSNEGGIPEIISHEKHGFIVDPNNPDQISKAILKIYKEDNIYNKMSKNCLDIASKYYDIKFMTKKFENLYFELSNSKTQNHGTTAS